MCNCKGSCSCKQESNYTGGGVFPMKKGSRGEAVRVLQLALNNQFSLPQNMKLNPDTVWGDKTEAVMRYLKLPTVIPNEGVYAAILAGKNPNQIASQVANMSYGLLGSQNTSVTTQDKKDEGTSRTTDTWKENLKNPDKAVGIFEKLTQGVSNLRNNNQRQFGQNQFGQNQFNQSQFGTQFGFQSQFGNPQQQQRRLPAAAWIAIGLVILLILGFVIYKVSKK
jgi:hypothetical protein